MKNKLLSRALLLMMVLLLFPGHIKAQEAFCENGIYFGIINQDQVAVISSLNSNYSGEITIPEKVTLQVTYYNEYYDHEFTVTQISMGAFRDCSELTRVNLPSTLERIGDNAFYGCTALSAITLPSSLKSIGRTAFGYCTTLKSVAIPSSVTTLGWNMFYYCTSLTDVTIPNSIKELNGTFVGCSALESVEIPLSVTTLDGTFAGCTALASFEIPQSITTLNGTFTGCTALTSIDIPESVCWIGDQTFANCTALRKVILPSSLMMITGMAFQGCNVLKTITCKAVDPPTMYSLGGCFDNDAYTYSNLFVPNASISDYSSTVWWNLFTHIYGLIYLNNPSLTLMPNQTYQLTAHFAPGFTHESQLVWESDNTDVATVSSSGLVKAISEGTAYIYAAIGDEKAVCEVIVSTEVTILGDVNGDGEVTISDVNELISVILDPGLLGDDPSIYDVNGDGEITLADVNRLIDIILNPSIDD